MSPTRALGLLCLLAACSDLTHVPPPPVPLSLLNGVEAAAAEGLPVAETVPGPAATALVKAAPGRALLTVHLPDLAGAGRRFQETSLYGLLTTDELAGALGPARMIVEGASMSLKSASQGPFDAQRLVSSLRGELVLSIEDVVWAGPGSTPDVKGLVMAHVRGAERDWSAFIDFVGMAASMQPKTRVEKGFVADASFTRVLELGSDRVFEIALYRESVFAGVGRESVTSALRRLAEGGESIEEQRGFQAGMIRCGDPRDVVRIHLDVEGVIERFGALLPPEAQRVLQAFGVDGIRSVTSAIRLDGRNIGVTTLLDSPGGRDLVTRLFRGHAVDRDLLERVPLDAASFTLFPVNGPELLAVLRAAAPPEAADDVEAPLRALREKGVDLEKDVFRAFGPRCGIVVLQPQMEPRTMEDLVKNRLLNTAFLVEVRDELRAAEVLGKLPADGRRMTEFDGVSVASYPFAPGGFELCFAVRGGCLVAALSSRAMERMLTVDPEASRKHFQPLFKEVPADACAISYDAPGQGLALVLRAMLDGFSGGLPGSPADTLSLGRLTRGFDPSVGYVVADDRGVFSYARSATGGLGDLGGVTGAATMASVALPALARARTEANEASAIAALRAIAGAQERYRSLAARDADDDGDGEYGFLSDLAARARPGERAPTHPPLLAGYPADAAGDLEKDGYYFRVYLPSDDGSPIGGHERTRLGQVDGDLAESVFVVVAWPVSRGSSGLRAFYMDATGRLRATSEGGYDGADAPPSDLFRSQANNLASEPTDEPRDGLVWTSVR